MGGINKLDTEASKRKLRPGCRFALLKRSAPSQTKVDLMIRLFRTSSIALCGLAALSALQPAAQANVISFTTDPFAGSTALTTPGRQIVAGEPLTSFSIASDVFAIDRGVFGIGGSIQFANDVVGNLPTGGVNVIVLQTFDNDANPGTTFGAGNAANLIAAQLTSPGPGFFIYFNSGLDLPRLVYSTDLSDNQADLKILARLTNLGGQTGRDAMPTFTAANFQVVPDHGGPLTLLLSAGALLAAGCTLRRTEALTR